MILKAILILNHILGKRFPKFKVGLCTLLCFLESNKVLNLRQAENRVYRFFFFFFFSICNTVVVRSSIVKHAVYS